MASVGLCPTPKGRGCRAARKRAKEGQRPCGASVAQERHKRKAHLAVGLSDLLRVLCTTYAGEEPPVSPDGGAGCEGAAGSSIWILTTSSISESNPIFS